jgi:hypothetical protein
MNIGIDSNIVVYAGLAPVNDAGTNDRKALALRAALFFYEHQDDVLFLPTIAISEILIPVPKPDRGSLIAKLADHFDLPPGVIPVLRS